MCETLNTPYMTRRRIIENLKEMVFGAKAFERFNDKERETLAMAAIKLEDMEAVETCNLDLASENENLLEQIQEMKAKAWIPVTERLPEVEGATRCLVTVDNYGIDAYTAIRTYFPETKNFNDTVITWMQLLEPYKEGNEE